MDEIRFFIERRGVVTGPVTDDDVRDRIREGKLGGDDGRARVRLAGSDLWASPRAFLMLAKTPTLGNPNLPASPTSVATELPGELESAPQAIRDVLLFWVADGDTIVGPVTGEHLRASLESGAWRTAAVTLVDAEAWVRATSVVAARGPSVVAAVDEGQREPSLAAVNDRASAPSRRDSNGSASGEASSLSHGPGPRSGSGASSVRTLILGAGAGVVGTRTRCAICLEQIPSGVTTCPECGEPILATEPSSTTGTPSIPDDLPGDGVFAMHWRPMVTLGAIVSLVCTGVALRYLAPGRFLLPGPGKTTLRPAALAQPPGCNTSCWSGEACQSGRCVWQPPNDVSHVGAGAAIAPPASATSSAARAMPAGSAPPPARIGRDVTVSGPFALPRDVSDVLPLDAERFAVALLTGLQVHNARTGGVLGLVTDAPQSRRLYRVGPVVYATAPQRIYVVDAENTRILKTIETGGTIGDLTVGASGRRVLASIPAAHAVAVLATEFHAEIDRIQFGDDVVGPVGADDTGKRALTTTGQVPLPGLAQPAGGAVYAFDPSRLASAQDRVRASMIGNPVSVLMTPDGTNSYVVLRAEDAIVPFEWQPSGALRQEARIATCREPEQIELVRRGRLGVVRCNEGRALEVFDLEKRELVRHVPFNSRVADLAVSPDGRQVIVALPSEGSGFIGMVDLETWDVRLLPVAAEPTRVRLSPDGSMALVLSDRQKVAWVIR